MEKALVLMGCDIGPEPAIIAGSGPGTGDAYARVKAWHATAPHARAEGRGT